MLSMGKSTISTGPFSIAMFDKTRGYIYIYVPTDVFAPEGTLIFYLKILILVRNIHQSSSG